MIGIALFSLFVLGPCTSTGPPAPTVTEEQMRMINRSFDALHEEVAAARMPSQWPFVLFIIALLIPLLAGVWILIRAERSVIGADETIRTLVRPGLSEPVLRQYLENQARGAQRPGIAQGSHGACALPRPRDSRGSRRRKRRRRRKHAKRHGDEERVFGSSPIGQAEVQCPTHESESPMN